jgi:hypothetical protein
MQAHRAFEATIPRAPKGQALGPQNGAAHGLGCVYG